MQLFFKLVNVALDLFELLFVSPNRLVPEVMVIHPLVMLEKSVTGERAFIDALVLAMLIEMVSVVVPAIMVLHAHVNNMDRVVVNKDVNVVHVIVQLEQIVCAQVQVDLRPVAQVRILHKRQIILNLSHMELFERLNEVTMLHLVTYRGEHFVDGMVPLLLGHLFQSGSFVPKVGPAESERDYDNVMLMMMLIRSRVLIKVHEWRNSMLVIVLVFVFVFVWVIVVSLVARVRVAVMFLVAVVIMVDVMVRVSLVMIIVVVLLVVQIRVTMIIVMVVVMFVVVMVVMMVVMMVVVMFVVMVVVMMVIVVLLTSFFTSAHVGTVGTGNH